VSCSKALASSLDPNPQALSASFNLVGSPLLLSKDPFIPPKRAAKDTRLGLTPDLTGAFKLDPSFLLKYLRPASFKPPLGF
jgi:hypothetical protein